MDYSADTTGRLYAHEVYGNTLVIRPRGDSIGFSVGQLRQENGTIRKLIDDPRVRHLLIDLSTERYFGSRVLGELLELGLIVKGRGGRIGLCEASDDLKVVLDMMQLNALWETFPTTAAALQSVARIPWSQRLWKYRGAAMALVATSLVIFTFLLLPRQDRGVIYAGQLVDLWEKYDRQRQVATPEEMAWLQADVQEKLRPMLADLLQQSRRRELDSKERAVLHAARLWLSAAEARGEDAPAKFADVRHVTRQLRIMLNRSRSLPPSLAGDLPAAESQDDETLHAE